MVLMQLLAKQVNLCCIASGDENKTTEDIIKDRETRTKYPVVHKEQSPCGVIIANEHFDNLPNLDGMGADVKKMRDFLSAYGIHCNVEKDANAKEMKEALIKLKRQDLSNGLVVTIMTHGGKGNTLYGTDGKPVLLKELAEIFNSAECENIPKIFIINACRGHKQNSVQRLGQQKSQKLDSKYKQYS